VSVFLLFFINVFVCSCLILATVDVAPDTATTWNSAVVCKNKCLGEGRERHDNQKRYQKEGWGEACVKLHVCAFGTGKVCSDNFPEVGGYG
jgi:hypothetical protein